jgi:RNA polymerase sigma-70 factor (ECF subfamily)
VREPEPETVGRARAGDLRAFESLVRSCQADVWRFAYHLTRNSASADDVTQETFLRMFRALGTYRGDQAKFSSWLLRIARNCATDLYRKARHEEPREDLGSFEQGSAPGSPEDRIQISEALSRLPHELREPFVVIEVLGYGYREASAILDVKVGTLKSRMHRARAALIRSLGREEAAGEV